MANKVEIYTTPSCKFCKMAKTYMKENDIPYREYNVQDDADRRQEMIEKSGSMSVPVIVADDDIMVGFDEGKLQELVDEHL